MNKRDRNRAPTQRPVDEYLEMPYTIQVIRDNTAGFSGFFARVVELPGCMTQADTFAELGDMIDDAMRAWIETAQEDGQAIPVPNQAESYSGKFVTRVPRSLHKQLVEAAERDGVSLNAFVNVALARVVGVLATESLASRPSAPLQSRGEYVADRGRFLQIAESNESDEPT